MSTQKKPQSCSCTRYYLFGSKAQCLHKLFEAGLVKTITRHVGQEGVEFYIYADKVTKDRRGRWWLNGRRTRLRSKDQILLAVELAEKYQVKRLRL